MRIFTFMRPLYMKSNNFPIPVIPGLSLPKCENIPFPFTLNWGCVLQVDCSVWVQ
ncbi:hypothetical protein D1AOALGA4SA_12637 [Olavius algarvensis Delta 1 endosymbiont]|nr:hypothetical protein D1AOALGA4SA_12637 [Olavius algarvensis Delta 1 endosymbiont]